MNMTPLAAALDSAKCVFFDFDGPICRLFSARPADLIARRLLNLLDDEEPLLLAEETYLPHDPLGILSAALRAAPDHELIPAAEQQLTQEEQRAARHATSTPDAHALIEELYGQGRALAITSNNSAAAIRVYLDRHGLAPYFSPHVHGRRADPIRLKPDPDCLWRALESTGTMPGECLMIGDSPSDWKAAETAGVTFVGYARAPHKAEALERAGVRLIVHSMKEILDAISGAAPAAVRPPDN
jgi:HAD superfamily hydrolase (TIGR01509 family)